jgi:rsbT co-antagonist protein RsbR
LARDVTAGAPEHVLVRTRRIVERLRAGSSVEREEWAFYPRGVPTMVLLDLRGVILPDGRFGVLNQALPVAETAAPSLQRGVVMARLTSVMSALVRVDGSIIASNPAAQLTFGSSTTWIEWLRDTKRAEQILQETLAGNEVEALLEVQTLEGASWHRIRAQTLRDPVAGELGAMIEHRDETKRVDAEQLAEARAHTIERLNTTLALVEQQRQEILSLSAPMLDVGDRTLAVPIIGRFGDEQFGAVMTKLLDAVANCGIRRVILDVTGVASVDVGSATHLQRLMRALRLLGTMPMITGVRPELALELIASGIDLEDTPTLRTLAAGLRYAKESL